MRACRTPAGYAPLPLAGRTAARLRSPAGHGLREAAPIPLPGLTVPPAALAFGESKRTANGFPGACHRHRRQYDGPDAAVRIAGHPGDRAEPGHPRGPEAGHHDPQDARGQGLGAGPSADARTGPQGQCLRPRSGTSALDRGAALGRRAGCRGAPASHPAEDPPRPCGAGHHAPHPRARRQPEPHHPPARPGRPGRGARARDLPREPEPALRHGAGGRHLLRRQHRRHYGLPLPSGRHAARGGRDGA